ncbi:response regulator [Gillisia hiemivivida]|uniref:Response regulator n=1 Tax=Gillisia hiemivivida TaxID=291190 RepID=A0A5C6ZYF9_9FLAO|nr:response regulator [Gillisia hiemivivida]TXD95454.1 response regulator [Gillisia hiemivivida]
MEQNLQSTYNIIIKAMDTFNYMVVDDDRTNNLICQLMIQKFDASAEIKLFLKPEEGLEYIENYVDKPTVLFLDVNMPTMSGWEFLDQFLEFKPEVKEKLHIYILTSAIQSFEKEKETYPFVKKILSKPLKKEYLIEMKNSFENKYNLS